MRKFKFHDICDQKVLSAKMPFGNMSEIFHFRHKIMHTENRIKNTKGNT